MEVEHEGEAEGVFFKTWRSLGGLRVTYEDCRLGKIMRKIGFGVFNVTGERLVWLIGPHQKEPGGRGGGRVRERERDDFVAPAGPGGR